MLVRTRFAFGKVGRVSDSYEPLSGAVQLSLRYMSCLGLGVEPCFDSYFGPYIDHSHGSILVYGVRMPHQ